MVRAGVDGFTASVLLLRLRWRMIRSRPVKVLIAFAGVLFCVVLLSMVNAGFVIESAAQLGDGSAANIYAMSWMQSLKVGGLGVGALAVGGAILVSFFAPFTGSSTVSLVPGEDLGGVRPARLHRFFDALWVNAVSGIGVMQLVILTAVTSVIVLGGDRVWAFLFTWVLWVLLLVLTTVVGFGLEWTKRRWGARARRLWGLALFAAVAVAVAVDPDRGQTLFGVGDVYAKVLTLSVESFSWWSVAAVGVLLAGLVGLVCAGLWVTSAALALPVRVSNGGGVHRARSMGGSPEAVSMSLLVRSLWRTRECRRPVLAVLVFGIPTVLLMDLSESLEIALPLTVPLAVALGWGVNVFGVLGPGMNWLASQPSVMHRLPRDTFVLQSGVAFVVLVVLCGLSLASGHAGLSSAWHLLLSSFVTAVLTAALSSVLSVLRPRRAPLAGPGDALVPPLVALIYLGILVMFGCLPGILVAGLESPVAQFAGVLGCVVAAGILCVFAWRKWDDPQYRANVVAVVSSG